VTRGAAGGGGDVAELWWAGGEDGRWGPPVSRREERAKAARLEVLQREEGGNQIRRHRHAGRLGRPRGRGPVGRGGVACWKKRNGSRLGRKAGWAES
jgi:hypothetical protein